MPDAVALELIGFARKIGKSSKRPRFRFLPVHHEAIRFMTEIEAALAAAGENADWLHRKNRGLGRKAPLEVMRADGTAGMDRVLQLLHLSALRASLKPG